MNRLGASILAIVCVLMIAASPALAVSATVYRHGSTSSKTIALTFDDGWNVGACQSIFNTLRSQHVPATFFPYSAAMTLHSNSRAFWRSVAKAGYPIADHSQTHPNMTRLSYASQLAQLQNSAAQVLSITGVPILPVFRPPGGSYNADTLRAAAAAGFNTVLLWDTSDEDTAISDIHKEIADAERGTNGSVILMHCGPSTTPYVVPDVIKFYRDRGFTFVTVAQMFGVPYAGPPISFAAGPIPPIKTAPPAPKPTKVPTSPPTAAPTATTVIPTPASTPIVTPTTTIAPTSAATQIPSPTMTLSPATSIGATASLSPVTPSGPSPSNNNRIDGAIMLGILLSIAFAALAAFILMPNARRRQK